MKLPDHFTGASPLTWGGGLLLSLLILVGSFYNLRNYPTIWWDEAIFSETAANLAQHDRYAFTEESPGHLRDLDFRISVGPAVILPVAAAYKLLGVGLTHGRLVAGAFLVLAFLALFLAARRLWDPLTALLAVALAFFGTDVLYWGRSVLGDIPALGLFLFSLYFLIRGFDSPSLWPLVLGGIFLGLAFDAKEFYALAFLPSLVILARQSWADKPRLARRVLAFSAGAAAPPLAYLALKAVILGSLTGAVVHFLQQKQLLCHEFFTPFTIGRLYSESVGFLLRNPLFWLAIMGVIWCRRREKPSPGLTLWIWSFFLWSAVYFTAVFWHRFALPALFLACPLGAAFLRRAATHLTAGVQSGMRSWVAGGVIAAFLILFFPFSGLDYFKEVLTCPGEAPLRLVRYLENHVPPGCLIETPEYELAFLDDHHRFHLMPSYFFVESTPDRVVLLNPRHRPYEFDRVGAEILILGSFGKSVFRQVYPPARITRDWRRVARVDYYDIYVPRRTAAKMVDLLKQTPAARLKASVIKPVGRKHVPQTFVDTYYH